MTRARSQRRWKLTLYLSAPRSQTAGMTLPEYEAFVSSTMFLDFPDPVAKWDEARELHADLLTKLSRAHQVGILGPDTDVTMTITSRTWVNSDGKGNMPSGEVFISLDEGNANGQTPFDEKIGGTVHLALGNGYPETGGTNVSALHWDLIEDVRGGGRFCSTVRSFSRAQLRLNCPTALSRD
ncbi:aminopeptidase (plasmid) [Deinococcus radiomollis]